MDLCLCARRGRRYHGESGVAEAEAGRAVTGHDRGETGADVAFAGTIRRHPAWYEHDRRRLRRRRSTGRQQRLQGPDRRSRLSARRRTWCDHQHRSGQPGWPRLLHGVLVRDPPQRLSGELPTGVDIANEVLGVLSSDGSVCVFTLAQSDLLIDVVGYTTTSDSMKTLTPKRFGESREGFTTFDGQSQGFGRTAAGSTTKIQIAGRGEVPAGAAAAIINVAVVDPDARRLHHRPCMSPQSAVGVIDQPHRRASTAPTNSSLRSMPPATSASTPSSRSI